MIEFSCLCGEKFSLPSEMAGESFQCDKCARLVIVPTLDDIANLDEGGGYNLGPDIDQPQQRKIFAAPRADSAMDAPSIEELEKPVAAPRYDPFTGELVRPMQMEEFIPSAEMLRPHKPPPLSKSRRELLEPPPKWRWVLRQMFRAHNSIVVAVVLGLHLIFFLVTIELLQGLFFFSFFIFFFIAPILAEYGLIVQETGPFEKDELPAPLRNFDLAEDVWYPLVHYLIASFVCLGPALFVHFDGNPLYVDLPITIVLGLAGFFAFPAVFMTAATDGIIANFRPDRLWKVMRANMQEYVSIAVLWCVGTIMHILAVASVIEWMIRLFHYPASGELPPWPWFLPVPILAFLMLVACLYILYFDCWLLGLYRRRYHSKFPWIAQRFSKDDEEEEKKDSKSA